MKRNSPKYDIDKLLFRRQFILGPKFVEVHTKWRRTKIRDGLMLSSHLDLNVHHVTGGDNSLTLLGFILDPYEPGDSDSDIVNKLMAQIQENDSLDEFIKCTYTLGGRWILIVDKGNEIRMFHDAAGYRQIYYTDLSFFNELWCASQPGIIAENLDLEVDAVALDFIDLNKYTHWGNKEYIFPGESSLYKGVKHLLPNHYLNLTDGLATRYWPNADIGSISLEECIERTSETLKGMMKSAANRFEMALSITSGRDTRLILASSKEVSDRLYYFTYMHWHLTEDSPDITIPARLLSRFGLKHNVIKCPNKVDPEFKAIYKRNVSASHEVYLPIVQAAFTNFPEAMIWIKGNAIPIVKCVWHQPNNNRDVDPSMLSELLKVKGCPFALRDLETWLFGVKHHYNINIYDLFSWEIKEGNWQAMSQLEFDIVQEVFVPFNCRALLIDMLSLEKKYRMPPEYRLHHELITKMWPDLLLEPINPQPKKRKGFKPYLLNRSMIKSIVGRFF